MLIDCTECEVRGAGCSDCVITALPDQGPALRVADVVELRAVEALMAGGVIAPVRVLVDDSGSATSDPRSTTDHPASRPSPVAVRIRRTRPDQSRRAG